MKTAVDYAGLVGKYIRMDRPATQEEKDAGEPPVIGMDCTVWYVMDTDVRGLVSIVSDEGIEFTVKEEDNWSFRISEHPL